MDSGHSIKMVRLNPRGTFVPYCDILLMGPHSAPTGRTVDLIRCQGSGHYLLVIYYYFDTRDERVKRWIAIPRCRPLDKRFVR